MTCPRSLQWLIELNPGNLAPESLAPHPTLYKLDFPENADQDFRTDHRTLEDPRKSQRDPPIELILEPPHFREGSERSQDLSGSPNLFSSSLAGLSCVTLEDLFNLAKPLLPHL